MACAEPRGGSQEDFEPILKGYYDAIRGASKPLSSRKKRIIKLDINNHFTAIKHTHSTSVEGAALFAVCRGKVPSFYILQQFKFNLPMSII